MDINEAVMDALKNSGAPVSWQKYQGKAETYITFFEYLQQSEQDCDDEENITGFYVQIDVWSKGDYRELVKNVKRLLKDAGFCRRSEGGEYETDTKIYHKYLRYFYFMEVQ